MEKKLTGQILGKRSSPAGYREKPTTRGGEGEAAKQVRTGRIGIEFREVLTRRNWRDNVSRGILSIYLAISLRAVREAIGELKDFYWPVTARLLTP